MLRTVVDALLRRPWLALVLALVIETVIALVGQPDYILGDPLWYAAVANDVAHDFGVFSPAEIHPFVMRVGLTVPVALFYKLFGVSTLVTNLYPLLAALGLIVVVYFAAPTPRAKLLGLVLAVFCTSLLSNATVLYADLPCATLMAAAVLCLARRDRPRGAWWIAGAAVATMAAFLVKETALWTGVVWLYVIVIDARGDVRAAARRFAPGLAVGAVLAVGYLALCAYVWGSPLARFTGIDALTYEHTWTRGNEEAPQLLDRLTWQAPWLFIQQFKALLIPGIAAFWLVRGRDRIWLVALAAFALLYWFGSGSLSAYTPLPIRPRMVMPVLPPLLVCATLALDAAIDRARAARRSWHLPVAIVLGLALVAPAARAMFVLATRPQPETAAFMHVRREARNTTRPILLVCNYRRCPSLASFYFEFDVPPHVTVTDAVDFARRPKPEGVLVRALVNTNRARDLDNVHQKIDALQLPVLFGHRYLRLYDAGDGTQLWQALQ